MTTVTEWNNRSSAPSETRLRDSLKNLAWVRPGCVERSHGCSFFFAGELQIVRCQFSSSRVPRGVIRAARIFSLCVTSSPCGSEALEEQEFGHITDGPVCLQDASGSMYCLNVTKSAYEPHVTFWPF